MDKSLKNILQIAIVAVALLAIIAATILFAGEDGFAKGAINGLMDNSTKGADDIVSKYINDIDVTPIELAPGLYDNSNNLLCSWESLVNDYGLVLDKDECDNMGTLAYVEGGKNLLYYIVYYPDEEDREYKPRPQFVGATKLVISDSVTTIRKQAFDDCVFLTSVTIPNSVTTIGAHAFVKCINLTNITIPNSVTFIGTGAFDRCENLGSISWNGKTYTLPAGQTDTELKNALIEAEICDDYIWCVWSRNMDSV